MKKVWKVVVILWLVGNIFIVQDIQAATNTADKTEIESVKPIKKHGLGHKLLFYIPNRILDIFDIVRARVKVGSGASYSLSLTKRASFFVGQYNTVYVGLPGPRSPKKFVSPIGREKLKGVILMGVDATDDTPYPPKYTATECQFGVQLLVVGVDAGIDFWEIADFFSGFVLIDLRKDDF